MLLFLCQKGVFSGWNGQKLLYYVVLNLKLRLDVYTPVDRNSNSELPCYCNMSECSRVENDKTCVWGLAAKKDGTCNVELSRNDRGI